jgi:Concanavalin A-like lectin/glucanases superfamily
MSRFLPKAAILLLVLHNVAEAGLVASFPMNEASWLGAAPQVIDTSGNGHNGTVFGGANTVADSMFGRVGSFDGSGQYIAIGGTGSSSGARTFTAWVDPQANSLSQGQPILVGGATGAGDFFGIGGTGGENNGIPQYHLYLDHYGIGTYDSNAAITPGKWTFVAMTYDGANTLDFYINGQAAGAVSGQLFNYNINTYTIAGNLIGGNTTVGSFNGLMNGVSIYNTALSSSQILGIYQSSAVPEPSSLLMVSISCVAGWIGHSWKKRRSARSPIRPIG